MKTLIMNNTLKTELESLINQFDKSLKSINVSNYDTKQNLANHCTDLLNRYYSKITQSVIDLSDKEKFSEYYFASFQYYRQCSHLLETYAEENI